VAKITFPGLGAYGEALRQLEASFAGNNDILERAAQAGANPVADEIRSRLEKLPEEAFHRLYGNDQFSQVPSGQKKDLLEHLGTTPPSRDRNGFVHVKVGWDGYGDYPTKDYPKGLPNALVARAVESGSSVRQKIPFVRPAVKASQKQALEAMDRVIDEDTRKIMEK
jgi:hypothetical protein